MSWAIAIHNYFKTDFALKHALSLINYRPIGKLVGNEVLWLNNLLIVLVRRGLFPSDRIVSEAFEHLIEHQPEAELREIPILDFHGLDGAKIKYYRDDSPNLESFASLLQPDYAGPEPPVRFATDANFERNKQDAQDGAASQGVYAVKHSEWNGRYYINNRNGAHHLAALYRQCKEQGRTLKLIGVH